MAIAASVAAGVATLMSFSATRAAAARAQTIAAALASQKIEQLTARLAGSSPPAASGSLADDESGFFDRFDAAGMPAAADAGAPGYVRRWSISPQAAGLCAVQVLVIGTGVVASAPVRLLAMSCGDGA